MKRYNNFLIVGIDHGYGNIKTANTVTPTGITKLDAAPTFTKNTLYYDGSYYLIGEGHKEYLPDKWQDKYNYLFTLMGIARELNREGITSADVHLAVGLPLTWVNRQREDFRKYMLQHESVDFKYEDKLYSIRIIGCSVFPQGYWKKSSSVRLTRWLPLSRRTRTSLCRRLWTIPFRSSSRNLQKQRKP